MLLGIGCLIVILCIFATFAAIGGHLDVLWQPGEVVMIIGSAIGAFIITNPLSVLKKMPAALGTIASGGSIKGPEYLELLTMLFSVFKLAKTKGALTLEPHIEKPDESDLFEKFPKFLKDHHAVEFFCDYMRMMTMGSEDPHQMSDLMEEELDVHHHEQEAVSGAIQNLADGLPALGIVAAVLGVIHTMGSINQPPEVLGHLIAAALVGTFLGILVSYGFVGPMAGSLKNIYASESQYYQCMKAGLLAYMSGAAPVIAVEFARKSIESSYRPSFYEVEKALEELN
jgi:chemotaxis protein MotA